MDDGEERTMWCFDQDLRLPDDLPPSLAVLTSVVAVRREMSLPGTARVYLAGDWEIELTFVASV